MALPADATQRLAWQQARLAPPAPGSRPRVVIDTDAANEIDDPFALAWALLAPERLEVLAVYAAPWSFAHRHAELQRAAAARAAPAAASAFDHELLRQHAGTLARLQRRGQALEAIGDWPVFCPPGEGMQRSFDEIVRVFELLRLPAPGRVLRGCTNYLGDGPTPANDAVEHLIASARATPADAPPLYVVALGCVTNIAAALRAAPDIAERIVVVWTSGWPSHAPHVNFSFNLEQDVTATRELLASGVPLVYLPGFHVGAQLRLSLPEIERHVQACGAIGRHLHTLYTNNPLADLAGIDDVQAPGFSWVIWDLINIAWLLDETWVPSTLVPTPALDDERRWQPRTGEEPVPMREAHAVARNAIFGDFFATLRRAPG
jgi:purine nucleosidase